MVSVSASVLVGREFDSAGSYQDVVIWYCSLFTRRTVCGRAVGNKPRTEKQTEWNESRNCTNSMVALQDRCSYKTPTTNQHITWLIYNCPLSAWLADSEVPFGQFSCVDLLTAQQVYLLISFLFLKQLLSRVQANRYFDALGVQGARSQNTWKVCQVRVEKIYSMCASSPQVQL